MTASSDRDSSVVKHVSTHAIARDDRDDGAESLAEAEGFVSTHASARNDRDGALPLYAIWIVTAFQPTRSHAATSTPKLGDRAAAIAIDRRHRAG